jgi:hypothetical protein
MITFSCPTCSTTFKVPDDKSGKQTKCPECQESLMVPSLDQEWWRSEPLDCEPPPPPRSILLHRRRFHPLYVVGGLSLVLAVLVCLGVVWAISHEKQRRLAAEQEQVATHERERATEQAKIDELKRLLEQQKDEQRRSQDEQARLRESDLRREAAKEEAAVTGRMREMIAGIKAMDEVARKEVDAVDRKCMVAFAMTGVDPRNAKHEDVIFFHEKRNALIATKKEALNKRVDELRTFLMSAVSDSRFPKDIKRVFDSKTIPVVAEVQTHVDQPYQDALAWRERAVVGVREAKEQLRKERVELSKRGADALMKYAKTLPDSSDILLSQMNLTAAFIMIGRLQFLLKEGKLTVDAIKDELEKLPSVSIRKYGYAFSDLVRVAGNWRIGHEPEYPSIRETFDEMTKLLKKDLRDWAKIED